MWWLSDSASPVKFHENWLQVGHTGAELQSSDFENTLNSWSSWLDAFPAFIGDSACCSGVSVSPALSFTFVHSTVESAMLHLWMWNLNSFVELDIGHIDKQDFNYRMRYVVPSKQTRFSTSVGLTQARLNSNEPLQVTSSIIWSYMYTTAEQSLKDVNIFRQHFNDVNILEECTTLFGWAFTSEFEKSMYMYCIHEFN